MTELLQYRDVTRMAYHRDLLEQSDIRTFIRDENLSASHIFPVLCILNDVDKQAALDLINADLLQCEDAQVPELICGSCLESSPANFDSCWKCGHSISHQKKP